MLFDYIKKYGHLSFDDKKLTEVDAGILSLISYLDLYNIVPENKNAVKLQNCFTYFLNYFDLKKFKKRGYAYKDIIKLCRTIKDLPRYKDILLYNYIYKISFDEQFCAITMKLPNNIVIINFEGTDHNLCGWEEDFAMFSKFPVSCEIDAIKYINKSISLFDKEVIVLGHSKGGHLSLVASMFTHPLLKKKIKKIYSFDGPGLRKKEMESTRYKSIENRYNLIIPSYSIVGLFLRHTDKLNVVKCTRKDLYAHSIFNWEIDDDTFKKGKLSKLSTNLDKSIILWLDEHDDEKRAKINKDVFDFLRANGITNMNELMKFKTIISLIKNNKKLDAETKSVLINFIKFNVKYHMDNHKKMKKENS